MKCNEPNGFMHFLGRCSKTWDEDMGYTGWVGGW